MTFSLRLSLLCQFLFKGPLGYKTAIVCLRSQSTKSCCSCILSTKTTKLENTLRFEIAWLKVRHWIISYHVTCGPQPAPFQLLILVRLDPRPGPLFCPTSLSPETLGDGRPRRSFSQRSLFHLEPTSASQTLGEQADFQAKQ